MGHDGCPRGRPGGGRNTGRIRHPAEWHAFRRPLGLTPGSHLVLELGTAPTNPCRWTRGTSSEGSCWWDRLPAGGVEITWGTRPPAPGRDAVSRTWSAATGQCAGLGGTQSLAATVTVPGAADGQGRFEVNACLADPGSAASRHQVDAMLDSLRP